MLLCLQGMALRSARACCVLLCLQGMANAFYKERVAQHLQVGLEAVRLLRDGGVDKLQSRKLRGFDEPPFR